MCDVCAVVQLQCKVKGKVREHAVAARRCGRSSPVTLAFETVVKINLLPRDTGLLRYTSFHSLSYPDFPGAHLSTNPFGRMNSWLSCAPTSLGRDRTWVGGFVVTCANHCTTEAHIVQSTHYYFENKPKISVKI